jgi:hypothetical protein
MDSSSTIWQTLKSTLWPSDDCEGSTQSSSDYQNPLRKARKAHSPREPSGELNFNPPKHVVLAKKRRFNQESSAAKIVASKVVSET